VTGALGRDTRIGRKYLKGALGYGGPCFPRDNVALDRLGDLCGLDLELTKATQKANAKQAVRVAERVLDLAPHNGVIAVLGMAYKPDTPVAEESQGVKIAAELVRRNANVTVHDPKALPHARAQLGDAVVYADSLEESLREADVVIIATAWEDYKQLAPSHLKAGATVVDCWRILPRERFERPGSYVAMGFGDIAAAQRSTVATGD